MEVLTTATVLPPVGGGGLYGVMKGSQGHAACRILTAACVLGVLGFRGTPQSISSV